MPTRKFQELLDEMPVARREKIVRRVEEALAAMPLEEVRRARQMTQVEIVQTLGVNQGEVSKIEHRTDVYLSTLASDVEALGGGGWKSARCSLTVRCASASLRAWRGKVENQEALTGVELRSAPASRVRF